MLNSTNIKLGNTTNKVSFNAPCTGILQRSHSKSRFTNFGHNGVMSNEIFPLDGSQSKICTYRPPSNSFQRGDYKDITVLQTMLYGDNMFLIEYVFNEDLEEPKEKE